MAIGDIKLGDTTRATSQARVDPNAFGAGIARAISGLAGATGDFERSKELLATATSGRANALEDADVASRFIHYQGEQGRVQARRLQATEGPAVGVTNLTHDEITDGNNSWLASIPERLREKYAPKLATLAENQITGSFNYEYQQGNAFFGQLTTDTTNELASQMQAGDIGADEALESVVELLSQSDIPDQEQQAYLSAANTMFMSVEFSKEIGIGLAGGGAVNDGTTGDIAMAGAQPAQRGLLNAIATPESGGAYDVRYSPSGGQTFEGYADHPRIYEEVPRDLNHYSQSELDAVNAGTMNPKKSSAAGRYQFTASTWDDAVKTLGLTDFSPESQDRAALWLAGNRYNQGLEFGDLTFDQMINSGDRSKIIEVKNALDSTWIGLRGMSDDQFANILLGAQGIAGGGTGNAVSPDLWNDPRYAGLSYGDKLSLAQDASSALTAQQTAQDTFREDQLTAARNDAYQGALLGDYTSNDESALIKSGILATADQITKFRKNLEDRRTGVRSAAETNARVVGDSYVFTGADDKSLNAYVGAQGLQSLGEMDDAYARQSLGPLVARTGFIPSDSAATLAAMANGTDTRKRDFAMGTLSDIYTNNPRALDASKGISSDMMKDVAMYSRLRTFSQNPEDLRAYTDFVSDPANAQIVKTRTGDARELFGELTTDQIVDGFDPGFLARLMPGTQMPTEPLTPTVNALLRQDAQALYERGFVQTGSEDDAMAFMQEQLQINWSATDIGGSPRVARHSPERYYDSINDDFSWIDFQVRDELGMGGDDVFELVADDQTLFEGQRFQSTAEGNNASYQVVRLNDRGEWEVQRGDDGAAYRIAFEVSDEMRGDFASQDAYTNQTAKLDNALGELQQTSATSVLGEEFTAAVPNAVTQEGENNLLSIQRNLNGMRDEAFSETANARDPFQQQLLPDMEEQAQLLWDAVYGPQASYVLTPALKTQGTTQFDILIEAIRKAGGNVPEGVE